MERDPRVSVCAYDPANPYIYFTVDGTVTLIDEGGDDLIDELSRKYDGTPWTPGRAPCGWSAVSHPTRVISR